MPDSTINGLTALAAASVVPGTDVLPVWQGSSSTTKKVTVADTVQAGASGVSVLSIPSSASFNWNSDTYAFRDSANVFAHRNGANAQSLRVYNTYTDASNYERSVMYWSGNQLYIGSEKAGTGSARVVNIGSNPAGSPDNALNIQGTTMRLYATTNFVQIDSTSNIYPSGTTQTLGASANPWYALYLSKTVTAGGTTGAQTINKSTGSVNFAAAATSLVVTNSLVTTSSVIVATVATNDTTMKTVTAVAAAGSFTLFANAAAASETRVNFVVLS